MRWLSDYGGRPCRPGCDSTPRGCSCSRRPCDSRCSGSSTSGERGGGCRWSVMASAAVLAASSSPTRHPTLWESICLGRISIRFSRTLQRNSHRGGSAIEGEAVLTFTQLPSGVIRVLFRPLPYEAETAQGMMSAIENTLLLVVTIWKLPKMLIGLAWPPESSVPDVHGGVRGRLRHNVQRNLQPG